MPIDVVFNETNISECSDLYSLLYYARQRLLTRHRAWSMFPVEDVGILKPNAWHVTPICIRYPSPSHIPHNGAEDAVLMSNVEVHQVAWLSDHFAAQYPNCAISEAQAVREM